GLPIVPVMDNGASDSKYLRIGGIPTYGVPGVFADVDDDRAHGRDERIGVKDFYDGVDFYYEFIKALAGGQQLETSSQPRCHPEPQHQEAVPEVENFRVRRRGIGSAAANGKRYSAALPGPG